jgi:hypothetical protein
MSDGTLEEQAARFFSWQEAAHRQAIECLKKGDGSSALFALEEVFRQCGRLEARPHYLIFEAALRVLEKECPDPEYRRNVVLEIHDRTVPSLCALARQYCYERTSRDLSAFSAPADLRSAAVPYAITAHDWRLGFEGRAGAVVPQIAEAMGGVEGGQVERLLRTAQLKVECELGDGESNDLPDLTETDVLEALGEAIKIETQFANGKIPSIKALLFGQEERVEKEVAPSQRATKPASASRNGIAPQTGGIGSRANR